MKGRFADLQVICLPGLSISRITALNRSGPPKHTLCSAARWCRCRFLVGESPRIWR